MQRLWLFFVMQYQAVENVRRPFSIMAHFMNILDEYSDTFDFYLYNDFFPLACIKKEKNKARSGKNF